MMFAYTKAEVSFRYLEEIGAEGKNSKVYRAHDEYLDTELVIKEVEKTPGFSVDQYFSEARTLYKSAHPHVVQVCYACEDADKIYVASPFYKNGSLKRLMSTRFLTTREIIRFSVHILNAVQNIHSKGLIHFDIKPDNVLLSDREEGLLADFGLTKIMDAAGIAQQTRLYTKQLPPEAFGHQDFDNRFDIYQTGLTMYRMCVGDDAFDAQFLKYTDGAIFIADIIAGRFPDRKAYPLHIPSKLQKIVNKCLKPVPGDRYGSAIEVVNALADIDGVILDWQFTLQPDGMIWEQSTDGMVKSLHVSEAGESKAYTKNGGATARRIAAFCKAAITGPEIVGFLNG
jgi:serine/threonine protein kinase